jgi:phage shock protein B
MEDIVGLIVAPIIIFLVVVAPIWLILHYRSKNKINQGLSEQDYSQLRQLLDTAQKLDERVRTLESILDAESPKWREKHER